MSKIVVVSGTPKARDSASATIIEHLGKTLVNPVTIYPAIRLVRGKGAPEAVSGIVNADVILFVFPLYVDALPAPLVKVLTMLAAAITPGRGTRVYAVCNCGFFEAGHTQTALDIIADFCERTGLDWQYGVGIGGGGYLPLTPADRTRGPAAKVFAVLDDLGRAIQGGEAPGHNVFVSPKMPRALYKLASHWSWRSMARKFHARALDARPYES